MDPIDIKIVRLRRKELPLPQFMSQGAAGCDLMADLEAPLVIQPLARKLIPTGISISIPVGYEAQIRPRSGLALKHGLTLVNSPGTIDSDYRGEIKVIMMNLGEVSYTIQPLERIAQMVFQRVVGVRWQEVATLDETLRGEGGFGHTSAQT
ncbi:MAG: dUTP diphosphatase [Deltaproteobacteria bacterium]|nr:dUTP diphosphatase [Deltaproteobacteria bacterium]